MSAPEIIDRRLDRPKDVKAFRRWLARNGAEMLDPTNAYEVVRFRGTAGLSIVYANGSGRSHALTGQAEDAWTAFCDGRSLDLAPQAAWIDDPDQRPAAMSDADLIEQAGRMPITIAFLMEHDALPMREASQRLFGLERSGRLVRSGGRPGTALTWNVAAEVRA
ncbi:hypothetical protein [Methylobacterium haplocladii]|uniref:Uncharacterized protein n=1 Tax=Methylobacterium haplocladii TaxID=1176176 RepID=A0A512ISC1_9HYPH|nr:hypothetical protein [Methylobacterium haplocladii]GEP00583.1 hypothetical protein MHA02_29700 [Methylobacterium haplocladii]GJD85498.1 hypothetical protein HPGCJGGD_3387 [Methylobacterium haplocladii]GLS57731.1 hypothetical protein GCM10007887_03870 [Methylobacterium haplocladii]